MITREQIEAIIVALIRCQYTNRYTGDVTPLVTGAQAAEFRDLALRALDARKTIDRLTRERDEALAMVEARRKCQVIAEAEIERVLALPHDARGDRPELVTLERRAIYAIAIYVGLRKSEIWRLRWEDVVLDGDRPRIHVREGKSDAAVRDVPLLAPVVPYIERWRDREAGVRRAFGLVFPPGPRSAAGVRGDSSDAGWRDHPYVYRGKRKLRPGVARRAELGRHVRFHDLRHTCASHLVMGSWTPRPMTIAEARRWLGHSSSSVTDRYAHMSTEGLHALIEAEESKAARKPPSKA